VTRPRSDLFFGFCFFVIGSLLFFFLLFVLVYLPSVAGDLFLQHADDLTDAD
jgi:hypothetical protein